MYVYHDQSCYNEICRRAARLLHRKERPMAITWMEFLTYQLVMIGLVTLIVGLTMRKKK